jgi:5-methylcytosine-specific restriction endonuclease McrA
MKSKEIREKANYLCEVCRDNEVITYDGVEVHHITKLSEDESLLLDDYNLICLCQEHHKAADAGQIDRDYLRELAKAREQGI